MNKTSKRHIDPSIGLRIRKCRESFAYSREKLAELAEISTSFLSDIELANRTCSFQILVRICKTLGVSADFILFGKTSIANANDNISNILSCLDEKYYPQAEALLTTFVKSIHLAENNSELKPDQKSSYVDII